MNAIPLLLLLMLGCSSCIPNKAYRVQLPPCNDAKEKPSTCSVQVVNTPKAEVPVAFVEFDDVGQDFNSGQIKAAVDTINSEQRKYPSVVTILFIHGWKNNASENSNNVLGFRQYLQQSRASLGNTGLVGVYFGWRGGTTKVPVIQELTYWNRRDTATYIPGSNMSEALLRIAIATKGPNYDGPSKLIVVGHSFGGLVLERTVSQYLTRRVLENPNSSFKPFADLLVFVNEAAAATEAIQLLTMLKASVAPQLYPTIVSITSQGDLATKFILPVGQGASLYKKSLRSYGPPYPPDPFGVANQRTYYLRSATHIPELQSHVVGSGSDVRSAYLERGYTCASISAGGKPTSYFVVPIASAKNTTPYWIMQMPVEIVPDHSTIFTLAFGQLLQAFVLRQFQMNQAQRPDPDICYSDPNKAPVIDMTSQRNAITVK